MNPTIITARVTDQHLQLVNVPLIASGGVDVIQVHFEFCGLWNGCGKSAVFYRDPEAVYHVPIVDGLATVPWEVLAEEGFFFLGVMGTKSNIRPTEVVRVYVSRGAPTAATTEPQEPTPDIYQQLLAAYGRVDARVDNLFAPDIHPGAYDALELQGDDGLFTATLNSNGVGVSMAIETSLIPISGYGETVSDWYRVPLKFAPMGDVWIENYPANTALKFEAGDVLDEDGVRLVRFKFINHAADEGLFSGDWLTYYPAIYPTVPELADARVRADGSTYDSAGSALRAVDTELSWLKAELLDIGNAEGELVRLTDVSTTEHEMTISLGVLVDPTTISLHRCGRNLLPRSAEYYHRTHSSYNAETGYTNNGVTFKVQADGGIVANGTATSTSQFRLMYNVSLPVGEYVVSSVGATSARGMYVTIKRAADGKNTYITPSSAQAFTIEPGDVVTQIAMGANAGEVLEDYVFYPMLEVGAVAGQWESSEGNTTHTPTSKGEVYGVMSIYPVTTLYTTTPGTLIKCEYEKDSGGGGQEASKKWAGKKWVAIGDSITMEGYYTTKAYHGYIADDTGIEVVNLGIGGTGFAKANNSGGLPYYQRISAETIPADATVITIMGGLNDPGAGKAIGEPTDTTTDTLCGCVNATIDALYAVLPTVPLGIIADPPGGDHVPTNSENTITKYFAAMEGLCRLRGIPFLDLFHSSGLRPWDPAYVEKMYSKKLEGDKTHPNAQGHALLAPKIKAFLETLIL